VVGGVGQQVDGCGEVVLVAVLRLLVVGEEVLFGKLYKCNLGPIAHYDRTSRSIDVWSVQLQLQLTHLKLTIQYGYELYTLLREVRLVHGEGCEIGRVVG
jgi:hypothetical protein